MHVLFWGTSPDARLGAAGRLCTALERIDIYPTKLAPSVAPLAAPLRSSMRQRSRLAKWPLLLHLHRDRRIPWSTHLLGVNPKQIFSAFKPQIIHLQWVAASWVSLHALTRVATPLVWTFHDVWPLTAGCHCNLGCNGWAYGCIDCPQLGSGLAGMQAAAWLWRNKAKSVQGIKDITIISPSRWMANMVSRSPIWRNRRIEHIPNTLDQTIFHPGNRDDARVSLGLPKDALVVAFGANGIEAYHKGMDLLVAALREIHSEHRTLHFLCFGGTSTALSLPCPTTFSGFVQDMPSLARIYQAADIFVLPSRQDNLPTTLVEAASCGIPSVCFDIGGVSDIVLHGETGYLARPFEVEDLAAGLHLLLSDATLRERWGRRAREHAEMTFGEEDIAERHMKLYEELLENWGRGQPNQKGCSC